MSWKVYKKIIFIGGILVFYGCATIGPYIEREELNKTEEELRLKALKVKIERTIYVNNIGYRILKYLPLKERNYSFLGILATALDKYIAKIFGKVCDEDRLIIYGIIKDSPAERADLKVGDIILKINNREASPYNFYSLVRNLSFQKPCTLFIERGFEYKEVTLYPQVLPYYVNFLVVEYPDINASAFPGGVAVTYGLLNFIKNDEELAIVLGHELAHLIKNHILKSQGLNLLSFALALAVGKNIEVYGSQDLGRLLGRAFSARFSRDFEREADFLGTLLAYKAGFDIEKGTSIWERLAIELPQSLSSNFLANHPTSSERLLRIKKIVEKIKKGELKVEEYIKPY